LFPNAIYRLYHFGQLLAKKGYLVFQNQTLVFQSVTVVTVWLFPECNICLKAIVQLLPAGLNDFFSLWPDCNFFLKAKMQILPAGGNEIFALRRACVQNLPLF
jgi:hypothetical protein